MAGREHEQAEVRDFLDALARREPYASGIVVYGPRGNGKTALQVWARREAEARRIPTLAVSASEGAAGEKLLRKLTARTGWLDRFRGVFLEARAFRLPDRLPLWRPRH